MKLAKWDDGFVLDADPRREDPLYYYLRHGNWGAAIGIQVDPQYEEDKATSVSIQIFSDHLSREAGMDATDRCEMYNRAILVLLKRFPKWSSVTLRSPHLQWILEAGSVATIFSTEGFSCSISGGKPDEQTWTKA